ncbi:site-specific integrase [Halorubrum sp. CBA1125]|uniref:tyrosine-type recombinase/integrase n=1 Tax=Halorubrum sp. CBA1125 TaxID=2668072 RepID=UPI0018D20339|nr:site-specific integrase [Halorubrum sp. CBA1125]
MTDAFQPEKAVEMYLSDREAELAKSSLQNHRYHLKRFLEFCEATGFDDMTELDGRTVYEYKQYRRDEGGVNQITLSNQLSTFRVFVRFCENLGEVENGLADKIELPDVDPSEAARDEMIEPERAFAVLEYLEKFEYASKRHGLFYLMWHTALRLGTVYSIDVDDFHPNEGYIELHHRPESETPLKNKQHAEREVNLKGHVCQVLHDYISHNRDNVTDDYGRKPLFTSTHGRLYKNQIRRIVYFITRPCYYSGECPHDEDPEECEATSFSHSSKCPSSISTHPIRRGSITYHLNEEVPKEVVSDRANVSPKILEKHYNRQTESEKRQVRKAHLDNL